MKLTPIICLAWAAAALAAPPDGLSGIQAWADLAGTVHLRWITAEPAKGGVQWGLAPGTLDRAAAEDPSCLRGTTNNSDSGIGFANNHRADFAGAKAWPLYCRITATGRSGAALQSEVLTVAAPKPPLSSVRRVSEPLTVDPGDWPLEGMPLTFGVPFPRGVLGQAENVRLLADKRELPTQARVVSRWFPDLSVKWLRLDTVAPQGTRELTLEYGTEVAPGAVWEPVDSGRDEPLPVDLLTLTGADGTTYRFAPAERVIEEVGCAKVVRRFAGPLVDAQGGTRFQAVVRLYHWRGVPASRWDVTLENDRVDEEMSAIQAFELRFPATGSQITVGRGEESVRLALGERVLQREDFEWVQEPSGAKGRRLAGVIEGAATGAIVLRHFWEQWPAAVGLEQGRLVLGLCPKLPADFYAGRKDEDKLYYALRDGRYTFRQGWSKTWEIWRAATPAGAGLAGELPVVSVRPRWLEDSGALGRLAVAVRDQFPGYDETLATNIDAFPAETEKGREYGLMNFGDWYGERTWNWGNLEYDLGHAFLTQFARTGYAPFRRRSDDIIRHERDVDTRHVAKDPRRVGQQWIHSIGHTAGYYDDHYKDMKVYAGTGWSDNRGHIWAQGMFEHYLLGGDTRSWETAVLIADWAAGPQTTNFDYGLAREPGWMLKLVLSAYAASEDPFYLNAARIMAETCHRKSVASGDHGFYFHKLSSGHCDCPDDAKHSGEAGFMLATQMTGLAMYCDVAHDEDAAADIAKTARFVVDTMWVPSDQGFRYTSCPLTGAGSSSSWILMHGLAFGAKQAGDAQLADLCRQALAAAWNTLPRSGKSAGYVLCNSAQALDALAQLPGKPFAEYRREIEKALASPARRSLPTRVPNPDFEDGIQGWPSRGWKAESSTEVKHGGQASLRLTGRVERQNEYVNTTYDSGAGAAWEITSLKPGTTYRLSGWVRVDQISPGAPAPSLRLALRDASGTRGGVASPAYDLKRPGSWQCLAVDAPIPAWNTRNYIALSTNTREAVEVCLYLDDVHLAPVGQAVSETPRVLRLEPLAAKLSGGASSKANPQFRGELGLCGPGAAAWDLSPAAAGTYALWARLDAGARLERIRMGTATLATAVAADAAGWVRLGEATVPGTGAVLRLEGLGAGPGVGRLVFTDVPCPASPADP